jgi:hypothetical protein
MRKNRLKTNLGPGDGIERGYSMTPVNGQPRRTNLDNVAEVLADVEEELFVINVEQARNRSKP